MEAVLELAEAKLREAKGVPAIVRVVMEAIEAMPHAGRLNKAALFDDVISRIIHTPGVVPEVVQEQLKAARDSGLLAGMVGLVCDAAKGLVSINAKLPPRCQRCMGASWPAVRSAGGVLAGLVRALLERRKSPAKDRQSKYVDPV